MKTVTERQVRSALGRWKRLSECGRPAAKMTHREIAARAFELLKDIYGDDVRMFSWHVHASGGEPRRIDLGFSRENVFRWDGAGGWDSVSFETEPVDAATLKDGDLEILSSAGLRMTGNESGPAFAEAKDALERIGRGWTTPITFSIKYVVNVSLDVEDPDAFREWLEEDEVLVESEGHAGRKSFSKEQKKNVAEAVTDLARDVFGDDIRLDGYDIPDTVVPGTEIVLTFGRESSFTWICNGSNPRRECDNPKLVSDRYVKLDPAPVSKLLDGDIELFRTAGLEVVFERRPDGRHLELPYADAAVSKACWEIGDRSILAVLNRGDVYDFSYDFKIGFRVTDLGAFGEWLDDDGEVLTESEGSAVVLDEDDKDRLCAALTDIARDIFGDGLEFRYHTLSVAAKRLMQGSRFSLTFRKESDFEWTGEPFFIDNIDDQMIEEMTKFGSEPVDDLQSGDLSLLDGTGLSIRKHLYAGRMTLEKWYAVQKVRQCFAEWPSDSIDTGEAFEFEYFFPVEFEVVDIARFSDWVDGLGQDDGELEEAETRPAFETFFVAGGPKQTTTTPHSTSS